VQKDLHAAVDEDRLHRLENEIGDFVLQLGLQGGNPDQESFSWARSREMIAISMDKVGAGLSFTAKGIQLFFQDIQLALNMLARAVFEGYTLRAREVKLLRRIGKDVLVIVPFVIILLIPLSPFGHVLVFGFIQRFFPDFYPSQFTEQRQNIMSMYSSITNSATLSIDAAVLRDGAAATGASAATSEAGADAEIAGAPNAAVQRNGATR